MAQQHVQCPGMGCFRTSSTRLVSAILVSWLCILSANNTACAHQGAHATEGDSGGVVSTARLVAYARPNGAPLNLQDHLETSEIESTLVLHPGQHAGGHIISRPLTLQGTYQPDLSSLPIPRRGAAVLEPTAGASSDHRRGLLQSSTVPTTTTVIDCALTGATIGITITADQTSVSGVWIKNCAESGIRIASDANGHFGVTLSSIRISNCSGAGITLVSGALTVTRSVIEYNALGGIVSTGGTLSVTDCIINGNGGSSAGVGAIDMQKGSTFQTLTGSTVSNNVGSTMGGVSLNLDGQNKDAVITNTLFMSNTGGSAGGGLSMQYGNIITMDITGCTFLDNKGGNFGGGLYIYLFYRPISIVNCNFTRNSVVLGSPSTGRGGGLYARQAEALTISNSVFVDNTAIKGGGISYERNGAMIVSNVTLTGNSAEMGGCVYTSLISDVTISDSVLSACKATSAGGGLACDQCSTLVVERVTFVDNSVGEDSNDRSTKGGAVYVYLQNEIGSIFKSTFTGNSNLGGLGGALYLELLRGLTVSDSTLVENKAFFGAGMYVSQTPDSVNTMTNVASNGLATLRNVSIDKNTATGGGGALYINYDKGCTITDCPSATAYLALASNEQIKGLRALNNTPSQQQSVVPCDAWVNNYINNTGYGSIIATGARKISVASKASIIGASSLPSSPSPPSLPSPSPSSTHLSKRRHALELARFPLGRVLADTTSVSNTSSGGSSSGSSTLTPPATAADLASLTLSNFENVTSTSYLSIPLLVVDLYGQIITENLSGKDNAVVTVTSTGTVSGQITLTASHGVAQFTLLALRAEPGVYNLTFTAVDGDGFAMNTVVTTAILRFCILGEITNTDKDKCTSCTANTYTLDPANTACDKCESNGECNGNPSWSVVPSAGYWHSSPFSMQMIKCVKNAACIANGDTTYSASDISDGRMSSMVGYQRSVLQPLVVSVDVRAMANWATTLFTMYPTALSTYLQLQCADGYTGNVCGVCADGYGLSGSACSKCNGSQAVSIVVYVLTLLIPLIFMYLSIIGEQSNLEELISARDSMRNASNLRTDHQNETPSESGQSQTWSQKHMNEPGTAHEAPILVSNLVLVRALGSGQLAEIDPKSEPRLDGSVAQSLSFANQRALSDMPHQAAPASMLEARTRADMRGFVAKIDSFGPSWNTVLRIAISYVQVLSLLQDVKLEWPDFVTSYYKVIASSSGSSFQINVSLDCALNREGLRISYKRTIVNCCLLLVYILFFASFMLVKALRSHLRSRTRVWPTPGGVSLVESGPDGSVRQLTVEEPEPTPAAHLSLSSTLVLIVCIVIFYEYPTVAQVILEVFQCGDLDTTTGTVTDSYKLAVGSYWTPDPDEMCYVGSHRLLAMAWGIPWLFFFCLGVPLASFVLLSWNRQKVPDFEDKRQFTKLVDGTYDLTFLSRYATLVKDYRTSHAAWESVIIMRKLLIVGAVVTLQGSGTNAQLVVISIITSLALVVHLHNMPYKDNLGRIMAITTGGGVPLAEEQELVAGTNPSSPRSRLSKLLPEFLAKHLPVRSPLFSTRGYGDYSHSRFSMNALETLSLAATLFTMLTALCIGIFDTSSLTKSLSIVIVLGNAAVMVYFVYAIIQEYLWGMLRVHDCDNVHEVTTATLNQIVLNNVAVRIGVRVFKWCRLDKLVMKAKLVEPMAVGPTGSEDPALAHENSAAQLTPSPKGSKGKITEEVPHPDSRGPWMALDGLPSSQLRASPVSPVLPTDDDDGQEFPLIKAVP